MQFFLFIGRFFLVVNTWTAIFAEWITRGETIGVDDSHQIFNVDCRVRHRPFNLISLLIDIIDAHRISFVCLVPAIYDGVGGSAEERATVSARLAQMV